MFRLIKLAFYGLVGYALYQLFLGIRDQAMSQQQAGSSRSDLQEALDKDQGRMMNVTGPGRGTTVSTEESSGTSTPHIVGRGVTQPET